MIVTVEDLLGQAKKREQTKIFKVYVTELDREIECRPISRKEYLELTLSGASDEDAEILYACCSIFREEKLISSLKCTMNPVEVIDKILSPNTIYALVKTILEKSDMDPGSLSKYVKVMDDDIKN